jgi:tetratricopeptide (TPR) repeat protein
MPQNKTSQLLRHQLILVLALLLSSCTTMKSSRSEIFFDSAHDDQNRAPASFSPPQMIHDGQSIDPVFVQSQADFNYSLGEAFSFEGSHQKAVEHFKATLVFDPNSPSVRLRLATEYLKTGQVSEALELVQAVVEVEPENESARMLLGGIFSSMRLYPKAIEQYELVSQLNPENTEAALYMGAIYAETQRYSQAIKSFDSLLKKVEDEQKPTIHYYLARVYLESKSKNGSQLAEIQLKKALELKPGFTEALLALGNHYASLNQESKAVQLFEDFQKKQGPSAKIAEVLAQMFLEKEDYDSAYEQLEILERQGDDPLNTKLKMALILIEKKIYDRAISKLKEILQDVPESDRARFYLAALYEQTREYSKAVAEYKKVPAESSYFNDSTLHSIHIHRMNKDLDAAEELAREALGQKSEEASFHSLYASLLNENKKTKEASVVLEKALKKFPENTQIMFYLGTIYDSAGQKEKVPEIMEAVIEKESDHVQALNYVAYTFADEGKNLEKAEVYARRAAALEPKDGYILDTLGWVLFKQGKIEDALKYLEAAHKLAPNVSVISEHLGDVYVKQAMIEKARKMYHRALELEAEEAKQDVIQSKISSLDSRSPRYPASQKNEP